MDRRNAIPSHDSDAKTVSIMSISSDDDHQSSVFDDQSSTGGRKIPEITDAPKQTMRKKSIRHTPAAKRSFSVDDAKEDFSTLALPQYERLTSEPVPIKKEDTLSTDSGAYGRPNSAPNLTQRGDESNEAKQLYTKTHYVKK